MQKKNNYKNLVTVQRLIETILTRVFFDIFLLFYGNLTILITFFSGISNYFLLYSLNKLLIKVAFLLYLGFIWVCWTAVISILAFFVSYLLNFCYCPSTIFVMTPSLVSLHFVVSLFKISNLFCSLFYATIINWAR